MAGTGATLTDGGVAVSPDGRTLAFVASAGGAARLYVRRLEEEAAEAARRNRGRLGPVLLA